MSQRHGTGSSAGRASLTWLLATTLRRSAVQWRMLLAVASVAILACTLVTALGLLVTMTEQGAVRGALAAIPAEQTDIEVRVLQSSSSLDRTRTLLDTGVAAVLGDSVPAASSAIAYSTVDPVGEIAGAPAVAYFGVLDGLAANATLVEGTWATAPSSGDAIPVTIPAAAARALDLSVGDTFTVDTGDGNRTAEVVGVYSATSPKGDYWARDLLHGAGSNPAFPNPAFTIYQPIEAFGPLLTDSVGFDAAGIPLASLVVDYHPDFGHLTTDELAPILARLSTAELDVRLQAGNVAETISYRSDAAAAVGSVAAGLVVTRSTVVVISLMLLILAVVAMGQTARLFTDARSGERQLMRARGASRRNIVALTVIEALALGLAAALASPPLALLVYRVLALQPPMVAAGMPASAELAPLTWLTAAAISLVFVVVLIAPVLRQSRSFTEEDSARARQGLRSGLTRSGIDIALLVLAAIAYWQLQTYRSVANSTASLAVDPVLVVGPALVLVAGALLCVRLVPVAAKLLERLVSRSRGAIAPLASWELGRRAQRATAAVLLLSLALAVGTFSLAFLATWRQSQVDQATLAVGPPVRMPAGAAPSGESTALAEGAVGTPQPAIRRTGQVGSQGADLPGTDTGGTTAQVLALTPDARSMVDRGRLSEVGGVDVRRLLFERNVPSTGIVLPAASSGLAATVSVGDPAVPLDGVSAELRAIIEDANGLLATVGLGSVPVDGLAHAVRGQLSLGAAGEASGPLRVVGFQASFSAENDDPERGPTPASIQLKDLAATNAASTALALDPGAEWYTHNADSVGRDPVLVVEPGWQLGMLVPLPADLTSTPASFALVGWQPLTVLSALLPAAFATELQVGPGDPLSLQVEGVAVGITVTGVPKLVPGSAPVAELTAGSLGLSDSSGRAATIVVDQAMLSRVLAQSGVAGPMADEWWVDVAAGQGAQYLRGHPSPVRGTPAFSGEDLGRQLQETPLRVATQAALWLAIVAGGLLAAVGFGVHSTATLRARRIELAQLRAIGLSRRKLLGLVASESLLLAALGTVFGIAIGILLVWLVGPLVAVSATGSPPVPPVAVQVPLADIGLLAVEMVVVLAIVVVAVARAQRFTQPADLLRGGAQP